MNRIVTRGLVFALFVVGIAPVLAQQPGGPGGRGGFGGGGGGPPSIATLVQNKGVKEELKLTDEQVDKFKTAAKELREKYMDEFKNAGKDKDKATELFKTISEETNKVMNKVVEDNLKPEQAKRLKQIQYQTSGLRVLTTDAELQKTLKLTESQIGEIKAIQEESRKDTTELRKGLRDADDDKKAEIYKKLSEVNKDATSKSLEKLNADQKKQWEEIQGPKFDYKPEAPTGGGRGTRPGV